VTRIVKTQPGAGETAGYRAGQRPHPHPGQVTAARAQASRAGVRPVTAPAPARRAGLAWPRLPAAAELATVGAGYAAYSLVRLAIRASRQAAFAHAAWLWQIERRLHLTAEPYLNHLAAAHLVLAEAAGYYYGLLHFVITALVLTWLYLRRAAAFPRLRSALVLATAPANVVFWAWPAAPPRFSVTGMTDILVKRDILGAAHPLAWLYPAATTLVVLASANHFVLDAAGGLALAVLGMLATSRPRQRLAGRLARPASLAHRYACAPESRSAPASGSRPAVTFPRRLRGTLPPGMSGGLWMAVDGLSAAATIGLYTTAWCPVGSSTRARRLIAVKTRREQ
jgi:hypothetical protein